MCKIIKVRSCEECPYRKWRTSFHTSITYCGKDKSIEDGIEESPLDIKDIAIIPKWCLLKDIKDIVTKKVDDKIGKTFKIGDDDIGIKITKED